MEPFLLKSKSRKRCKFFYCFLFSRISPRSPEVQPPARKPYVHTAAIDSHVNDTYCKTQITPTVSNSSESSEPQYANLDSK